MSRDRYSVFRKEIGAHFLAVFLGFMLLPSIASGQTVTLTMDDLGMQAADGLMHPTGVNFTFTIDDSPSDAATYGGNGPGITMFVDDPSIEGPTSGVLTIDFPAPSSVIEFGIALLGGGSIVDAVNVELLSPLGDPVFSDGLDFETLTLFAEAQFSYSGVPVMTAVVDFTPVSAMLPPLPRFAFDNLTFVIPEPTSLTLVCLVICVLGTRRPE